MKAKVNLSNIKHYLVGNFRYKIYYSYLCWFIIKHIREQIDMRIRVMNKVCLDSGSCVKCGCATTALQMCNKACEGKCYPTMMNRSTWRMFKRGVIIHDKKEKLFWEFDTTLNKPVIKNC